MVFVADEGGEEDGEDGVVVGLEVELLVSYLLFLYFHFVSRNGNVFIQEVERGVVYRCR